MTRAKHSKQSWRVMKEWTKLGTKMSKLCKKCMKDCKYQSVGELTFCRDYEEKEC